MVWFQESKITFEVIQSVWQLPRYILITHLCFMKRTWLRYLLGSTVDAIALFLMHVQAQIYPHLSLPPHLIGGEGDGAANLSGIHSSRHFTSYLSYGGITGGCQFVHALVSGLAHHITSFGIQPQAFCAREQWSSHPQPLYTLAVCWDAMVGGGGGGRWR